MGIGSVDLVQSVTNHVLAFINLHSIHLYTKQWRLYVTAPVLSKRLSGYILSNYSEVSLKQAHQRSPWD